MPAAASCARSAAPIRRPITAGHITTLIGNFNLS